MDLEDFRRVAYGDADGGTDEPEELEGKTSAMEGD